MGSKKVPDMAVERQSLTVNVCEGLTFELINEYINN